MASHAMRTRVGVLNRRDVSVMQEPILLIDSDLRVRATNRAFQKLFQLNSEQIENHYIDELGNGDWNITGLRKVLEAIYEQKIESYQFQIHHQFSLIGRKRLMLRTYRIYREHFSLDMFLISIEDITDRAVLLPKKRRV